MGDSKKRNSSRPKKRKSCNPAKRRKLDQTESSSVDQPLLPSSSAKKLGANSVNRVTSQVEVDQSSLGNAIVNLDLLVSFVEQFVCKDCKGDLKVSVISLAGLAQQLEAVCELCEERKKQDLSNLVQGKFYLGLFYSITLLLTNHQFSN